MNRHLGEGTLQALLDGELSPFDRAAAETHLGSCPECAAELRELRTLNERAAGLLARADVPAPVAQAQMRMRARRARTAPRAVVWRQALLRAALLVLGVTGVAAAAVPGSPVREWIVNNVLPRPKQAETPALRPAPPAPAPAAAEPDAPAGVSIPLEGGSVRVVLTGATPGMEIVAKLVDGPRAGVLVRGDAAETARFRTSTGRIEVLVADGGSVEVLVPRGIERAALEVNGRVYVTKQGDSLVRLPAANSGGGPTVRVGG